MNGNDFTVRTMAARSCDRCGAPAGWPCIPESKQLVVGLHAERMIAQSAADIAAKDAAREQS
jgi:hypothetical protein